MGLNQQSDFFRNDLVSSTINAALDGLDLLNKGDIRSLEDLIPQQEYRRNFIGLAQRLAPDGEDIKSIGLTTKTRSVAIVTSRRALLQQTQLYAKATRAKRGQRVELHGLLLEANAKKQAEGIIQIVEPNKRQYTIHVPRGMMSDIVKPMFEEEVIVFAIRRGRDYYLETIDLATRPPQAERA
jgi:hypothetical protein